MKYLQKKAFEREKFGRFIYVDGKNELSSVPKVEASEASNDNNSAVVEIGSNLMNTVINFFSKRVESIIPSLKSQSSLIKQSLKNIEIENKDISKYFEEKLEEKLKGRALDLYQKRKSSINNDLLEYIKTTLEKQIRLSLRSNDEINDFIDSEKIKNIVLSFFNKSVSQLEKDSARAMAQEKSEKLSENEGMGNAAKVPTFPKEKDIPHWAKLRKLEYFISSKVSGFSASQRSKIAGITAVVSTGATLTGAVYAGYATSLAAKLSLTFGVTVGASSLPVLLILGGASVFIAMQEAKLISSFLDELAETGKILKSLGETLGVTNLGRGVKNVFKSPVDSFREFKSALFKFLRVGLAAISFSTVGAAINKMNNFTSETEDLKKVSGDILPGEKEKLENFLSAISRSIPVDVNISATKETKKIGSVGIEIEGQEGVDLLAEKKKFLKLIDVFLTNAIDAEVKGQGSNAKPKFGARSLGLYVLKSGKIPESQEALTTILDSLNVSAENRIVLDKIKSTNSWKSVLKVLKKHFNQNGKKSLEDIASSSFDKSTKSFENLKTEYGDALSDLLTAFTSKDSDKIKEAKIAVETIEQKFNTLPQTVLDSLKKSIQRPLENSMKSINGGKKYKIKDISISIGKPSLAESMEASKNLDKKIQSYFTGIVESEYEKPSKEVAKVIGSIILEIIKEVQSQISSGESESMAFNSNSVNKLLQKIKSEYQKLEILPGTLEKKLKAQALSLPVQLGLPNGTKLTITPPDLNGVTPDIAGAIQENGGDIQKNVQALLKLIQDKKYTTPMEKVEKDLKSSFEGLNNSIDGALLNENNSSVPVFLRKFWLVMFNPKGVSNLGGNINSATANIEKNLKIAKNTTQNANRAMESAKSNIVSLLEKTAKGQFNLKVVIGNLESVPEFGARMSEIIAKVPKTESSTETSSYSYLLAFLLLHFPGLLAGVRAYGMNSRKSEVDDVNKDTQEPWIKENVKDLQVLGLNMLEALEKEPPEFETSELKKLIEDESYIRYKLESFWAKNKSSLDFHNGIADKTRRSLGGMFDGLVLSFKHAFSNNRAIASELQSDPRKSYELFTSLFPGLEDIFSEKSSEIETSKLLDRSKNPIKRERYAHLLRQEQELSIILKSLTKTSILDGLEGEIETLKQGINIPQNDQEKFPETYKPVLSKSLRIYGTLQDLRSEIQEVGESLSAESTGDIKSKVKSEFIPVSMEERRKAWRDGESTFHPSLSISRNLYKKVESENDKDLSDKFLDFVKKEKLLGNLKNSLTKNLNKLNIANENLNISMNFTLQKSTPVFEIFIGGFSKKIKFQGKNTLKKYLESESFLRELLISLLNEKSKLMPKELDLTEENREFIKNAYISHKLKSSPKRFKNLEELMKEVENIFDKYVDQNIDKKFILNFNTGEIKEVKPEGKFFKSLRFLREGYRDDLKKLVQKTRKNISKIDEILKKKEGNEEKLDLSGKDIEVVELYFRKRMLEKVLKEVDEILTKSKKVSKRQLASFEKQINAKQTLPEDEEIYKEAKELLESGNGKLDMKNHELIKKN